jgi:hypothetical protein
MASTHPFRRGLEALKGIRQGEAVLETLGYILYLSPPRLIFGASEAGVLR